MHPCCGGSLQTGTKIIAIVHLLLSITVVVFGVLTFSGGVVLTSAGLSDQAQASEAEKEQVADVGVLMIIVSICFILTGVVSILMAALLLTGANKRNRTMCMVWFILNLIYLVGMFIVTIEAVVSVRPKVGSNAGTHTIMTLLQSYFLWVVWAFITELKEEAAVTPYGNTKARV